MRHKRQHQAFEIPAGEFKARCLRLMEEVRDSRIPIVITKHGRPIARLVPIEDQAPALVGYLRGTVSILDDIILPVEETWEADA